MSLTKAELAIAQQNADKELAACREDYVFMEDVINNLHKSSERLIISTSGHEVVAKEDINDWAEMWAEELCPGTITCCGHFMCCSDLRS